MPMIYYKKKKPFSAKIFVENTNGQLAVLTVPISGPKAFWVGKETITFAAIGAATNSYRILIEGKSAGYIHINFLRNGATINIVKDGSYQYEVQNLISQHWSLRKDRLFIEGSNGEISISQFTYEKEELVIASSIFITAKIGNDLTVIIPLIIIAITLMLVI